MWALFVKGSPKREFLDIYLITFWGVPNFGNTYYMRVLLFFSPKLSKIDVDFRNAEKNRENRKSLSEIRVSELVA